MMDSLSFTQKQLDKCLETMHRIDVEFEAKTGERIVGFVLPGREYLMMTKWFPQTQSMYSIQPLINTEEKIRFKGLEIVLGDTKKIIPILSDKMAVAQAIGRLK